MAKEKIAKTNAARLLDKDKIKYELVPYEVDENDLSCVHVAATLGENIEQVFKTLVLHGDKSGYFVCVIPGEHEIDLKMAAKVSGNKKCDLIPVRKSSPHRKLRHLSRRKMLKPVRGTLTARPFRCTDQLHGGRRGRGYDLRLPPRLYDGQDRLKTLPE